MGKGARNKAGNAEKKQELLEKQRKDARRKTWTIIISVVAVIAVLAGIGALIGVNAYRNSGAEQRAQLVMKSDNYTVNGSMMTYLIFEQYKSYVNYYGNYLSYYSSLDTSKDLKDQEYSSGTTWYQYFAGLATDYATNYLVLSESAKADGVELSADETSAVAQRAQMIYDTGLIGRGVNKQDIVDVLSLTALAQKYQKTLTAALTPSESDITAYYEKNPLKVEVVDYLTYTFTYTDEASTESSASASSSTEATAAALTKAEAKAKADELAATKTASEYTAWLEKYLTETASTSTADSAKKTKTAYVENDELSKWLFDDATKAGDVKVVESSDAKSYTVNMLTATKYKNTESTVSARHILLSSSVYGSAEAAQTKADELLAQWKSGAATEESFGALALAYSDDEGSYLNGGLYEAITSGSMVTTFNDWIFDASRKTGDTGTVTSDYGVHVMYFVGADLPKWEADVRSTLLNESYSAKLEELKTAHAVTTEAALIEGLTIR